MLRLEPGLSHRKSPKKSDRNISPQSVGEVGLLRIIFDKLAAAVMVLLCLVFFDVAVVAKPSRTLVKSPPILVVAFAGWAPTGSFDDSAIPAIVDRLRQRGASAEVHLPDEWQAVAARLAAQGRDGARLVLFGYSMGARSALQLAEVLQQANIPVYHLVLLEAWYPPRLPSNVEMATHYYSSGQASRIVPGSDYRGKVQNIDLNGVVPKVAEAGHVKMSHMTAVQDIVIASILSRSGSLEPKKTAAAIPQ